MELKPIDITLSDNEKTELLKYTIRDKTGELEDIERKMRELKRVDAETEYLSSLIGVEYVNPENKDNSVELKDFEEKRRILGYIITCSENRLAESEKKSPGSQQEEKGAVYQKFSRPQQQNGKGIGMAKPVSPPSKANGSFASWQRKKRPKNNP